MAKRKRTGYPPVVRTAGRSTPGAAATPGGGVPTSRSFTFIGTNGLSSPGTFNLEANRTISYRLDPTATGTLFALQISEHEQAAGAGLGAKTLRQGPDGSLWWNGAPVGGALSPTGDYTVRTLALRPTGGNGSTDVALTASGAGELLVNGSPIGGFDPSQPQTITAAWSFTQPLSIAQATTTAHAVRASRTLTVTGTTNQVKVSGTYTAQTRDLASDRSWTISLPQDIHADARPQFAGVGLGVVAPDDLSGLSLKAAGGATFGGTVGSTTFSSGAFGTGWRVDPDVNGRSYLELDDMRIRGELRTHVFRVDELKVVSGDVYISHGTEVTSESVSISSTPTDVYVKDASLEPGDLVWGKGYQLGGGTVITSVKAEVTADGQVNGQRFVTLDSDTLAGGGQAGTLEAGMTIARIGSRTNTARQGGLYFTGSSTYGPHIDVYDGVSSFADFQALAKVKARLGALGGITSANLGVLSGYGIWTNRAIFEAGAEYMSFDTVFRLSTERLGITGDGTVRVGTANGARTVISNTATTIYATSADYAQMLASGFRVFENSLEVLSISSTGSRFGHSEAPNVYVGSSTVQVQNASSVLASFGSITTVGGTGSEHVRISSSGTEIKNGSTVRARYGAITTIGPETAEHMRLEAGRFSLRNGATELVYIANGTYHLGGVSFDGTTTTLAAVTVEGTSTLNGRIDFGTSGAIYSADYGQGNTHHLRFDAGGARGSILVGDIPLTNGPVGGGKGVTIGPAGVDVGGRGRWTATDGKVDLYTGRIILDPVTRTVWLEGVEGGKVGVRYRLAATDPRIQFEIYNASNVLLGNINLKWANGSPVVSAS